MSYAQLVTDIGSVTNRTDLTSVIPRFVALAEAKMNRRLRLRQQEGAITNQAIASYAVALPADFLDIKVLTLDGHVGWSLQQTSREAILQRQSAAEARMFAVSGTDLVFDGTGSVSGVYFKSIPSLQTASTNWLETLAPDLYLAGALEEAYRYLRDEKEEGKNAARFDSILAELVRVNNSTGGPIISRRGY